MAEPDQPGGGRQVGSRQPTPGQLLRRYRSAAGLTQEELADRAGYSANYIGKLERDQRNLPATAAGHFGAVLGLTDTELATLANARSRAQNAALRDLIPPAGPLAGRVAELAQIEQLLDGAGPPVLLLSGEPGIGKTRLLDEASARARTSGWRLARGSCLRRGQDAYAPLSGALAAALVGMPAREQAAVLAGAGRTDLLLPEFGGPRLKMTSEAADPERQRRLLIASARNLLRTLAGSAGTLLVLDDLQWAGPDAVGLLAALFDGVELPVRVIGAYRDSETQPWLAELIADFARAALIRVAQVGPLTDDEAGWLLTELSPAAGSSTVLAPMRAAIVRRAGGVPLFLVSYAEQADDATEGEVPAVPWTVAQVISQRLAALPAPVRQMLSAAAIAGPSVRYSLLAEVTTYDDDQLVDTIEAALTARMLAEDGPDGYRFPHDVIRETLEEGMSAARRRLLHRRVGQALRQQPGASPQSLAFHFERCGEDQTAIGYLELAGDQAQQQAAYAAAAGYYHAAGRLCSASQSPSATLLAEKQGVALFKAARYEVAITALDGALSGYQAAGEAEGAARVTGQLALAHYRAGSGLDAFGALGAHLVTSPPDVAVSPGMLTRWQGLTWLLYAQGSYAELVTAGRALVRAGRDAGHREMEVAGARVEGAGLICLGRLAEGTALMAAALPGTPVPDQERAVDSAALLSSAYLAMGAVSQCLALSERMLAAAEQTADEDTAAMHTVLLAAASFVCGDWRRGRTLVAQAQRRFTTGASPMAVLAAPMLGSVLIWSGAREHARAYLDDSAQAARSLRLVHIERAALGFLAELDLLDAQPAAALARVQPLIAGFEAPHTQPLTFGSAVQILSALAAVHLAAGDLGAALAYSGRAVGEARRMGAWTHGVRALEVQGTVQAASGSLALAHASYREGLGHATAMPFPYGEARLRHAAGLLHHAQGDDGAARAGLSRALSIFDQLGADDNADQLRELLAGVRVRGQPRDVTDP